MATVIKPVRRSFFSGSSEQEPLPPRRRWRWFLAGIAATLVFVWLIPMLVANSPILHWTIGRLAADLQGRVATRSASLGWFSRVELSDVEVKDSQDQPVLEVPKVTAQRSLLGLIWDQRRLGGFRLEKPKFTVVLREDGTNLEDLLAKYLAPQTESSGSVDFQLTIADGQITVHDPRAGRSWQIDGFQLTLAMPADEGKPVELQASGTIADRQRPGQFRVSLKMGQTDGKPDDVTLRTENVPMGMFARLLGRIVPGVGVDGWLSASLQCQSPDFTQPEWTRLRGQVTAEQFLLTASQLGADRIALERLQTSGQMEVRGRRLQVDQLMVQSDLGELSAVGAVDLDALTGPALADGAPSAGRGYELQGQLDLARLAAMLPNTLRLRKETRVTSGQVQVSLSNKPGPEGMTWQGRLDATQLTAENQGQRLAWPRPISAVVGVRQTSQGLVVDNLRCDSEFLKIEGAGTTQEFNATVSVDLNQLVGQLNGLVDFGGLRPAGDGWVRLHWRQPPGQDFQADGQLQVQNLHLSLPDRPPWTEEKLWANFSATGRTNFESETRLNTATLEIKAGEEYLQAQLVQPILDFRGGGTWPVSLRSGGELARLISRLSPWFALPGWQIAGKYECQGQITGKADAWYVTGGKFTAEPLHVQGPGWNVQEEKTELTVDGGWDQARRRVELKTAGLTSTSMGATSQGLIFALPAEGPIEAVGSVALGGDLGRLQQWIVDPAQPPAWRVAGQLGATVNFKPAEAATGVRIDGTITNLAIANASGPQFQEPQVRLVGQGSFQPKSATLLIEQAELSCGAAGVSAAGQVANKDGAGDLQLDGKVQYDLEKLSALLRSYLGDGIYAVGRGSHPAGYHGPWSATAAQASAGLGWKWANLYGFEIGPGEIQATLADGVVQTQPLDLAVSEGRVRLAPQVRLTDGPATLAVAPGRLAEQIRINPTMCAHALQYIAPVMAGVATAEGRFSIEMDACRLPLADLAHGELGGRMIVHSVQVGPGPLVQELAIVLNRASPAQLTRESVIPFRMVDGRVYHQNLELVFPDVTIRTHGSVGLDQSLAIMAEMPVPRKWIGNNPLGAALRNQVIRLPIAGTLSKPAIDQATLDRLSQQFVQNAAQNVLQDAVNRHQDEIRSGINKLNQGLDRLFGPPPQVR